MTADDGRGARKAGRVSLRIRGYSLDPEWLRAYDPDADLEALTYGEAKARRREVEAARTQLRLRQFELDATRAHVGRPRSDDGRG